MRPPDNRGGRRLVSNSRINICKYKKYYFRHEGSCSDIKKSIDAGLKGIKSIKMYTLSIKLIYLNYKVIGCM